MTEEIGVGGITVELSHPGKVLFPDDGITKHDLAAYYADVAGPMLPWLRDRPITMARYGWLTSNFTTRPITINCVPT